MRAGFFRRLFSSIIDMMLIFSVIYLSFILFGQSMLQSKVENFDEISANYDEIMAAYSEVIAEVQKNYDVQKELAGEDQELLDAAFLEYQEQTNILNEQNTIDTAPYMEPLGIYFTNVVYYYLFIFLIIMTLYTLILKGATVGRRFMKIKLEGPVNLMTIFLHDIAFKYLLVVVLVPINVLYAIMFLMFMFLVDTGLIAATQNKITIRDMISKITVERTEYKY
jgi:hypothetical protein